MVQITANTPLYDTGPGLSPWHDYYERLNDKIRAAKKQQTSIATSQQGIIADFQTAMDKANAANESRYQEGLGIYDELITMFQPGGDYGKGAAAYYEQGKSKAKASNTQSLVNAGMANLTQGGGFDKSYEKDVGVPFWLNLNDMQMGALAQAMNQKVGFIEKKEDAQPDLNLLSTLLQQSATAYGGSSPGIAK